MRTIYYLALDVKTDLNVKAALEELGGLLSRRPTRLEVEFVPLPPPETACAKGLFQRPSRPGSRSECLTDLAVEVDGILPLQTPWPARLLVYWPAADTWPTERRLAEGGCPPLWGARIGPLAMVWQEGNPHVLWHEALHLLGAEDCYDELRRPTCGTPACIMHYAPWPTDPPLGLSICPKNVAKLRKNNPTID